MHSGKVGTLIIGGGIIGLSIGYYLSKRNFGSVELIERDSELTMHASGHNAGGLAGVHESQPRELQPLFRETRKLYRELALTSGFDFDYATGGTLSPGTTEDSKIFEKIADNSEGDNGATVEFIDGAELKEREPNLSTTRFTCGLFYPEDAQGNSKKLGQSFARSCLESGMEFRTSCKVIDFKIDHGKVSEVETNRGKILPETVIVAAGPWSGQVSSELGLRIPIEPIKGHLISIESNTKLVNSFIDGPRYYVMQNGSSIVVGGGEDSRGFDVAVDPAMIVDAWLEGVSMVPKLASMNQESQTACLRPFAPGGLPVLGKTKRLENVVFATGHYKNGFGLAPITGKLISQLVIDGETEIDISPFSPDRFAR